MSNPLDAVLAACAERIPAAPRSFQEDRPVLGHALDALLAGVRDSHERYAFDREGRPAAIEAVRRALPAMEADLLDVILDDVACELAAYQEALYRLAAARRPGT